MTCHLKRTTRISRQWTSSRACKVRTMSGARAVIHGPISKVKTKNKTSGAAGIKLVKAEAATQIGATGFKLPNLYQGPLVRRSHVAYDRYHLLETAFNSAFSSDASHVQLKLPSTVRLTRDWGTPQKPATSAWLNIPRQAVRSQFFRFQPPTSTSQTWSTE